MKVRLISLLLLLLVPIACRPEEPVSQPAQLHGALPVSADQAAQLHGCIAAKRHSHVTPDGLFIAIPFAEYHKDIPWLIIAPRLRTMDGTLAPAAPYKIEFISADAGRSPGAWDMRGREICLAIPAEQLPGSLAAGREYRVRGYYKDPASPVGYVMHTVNLQTPADPVAGQIYRIDLVLFDERVEQARRAEEQAKAAARARAVEEEAITVVITDPPAHPSGAGWVVAYGAPDTNGNEAHGEDAGSPLILKGLNKLGGELVVIWHHLDSSGVFTDCTWAYIAHLQKRDIALPQDADWIFDKNKTVPIRLTLAAADAETLKECLDVFFFYPDDDAQMPLFDARKRARPADTPLDLDVIPGTYVTKALLKSKRQPVTLGRITFTEEPGKTYRIELN